MQASELRLKRLVAGITGDVLCQSLTLSRSRLSAIERGCTNPKPEELDRIAEAIDRLAAAKARVDAVAAEVGWPTTGAMA